MIAPAFSRRPIPGSSPRSGAALLLSLFVLIIILAIVFQIKISTSTEARVARNDLGLTKMEHAIESILLDYFETLSADSGAGAGEGETTAGMGGSDPLGDLAGAAGGAEGAGGDEGPNDSRQDDWARPRRLSIGDIELEVHVQPENSKFNILAMLTENEDEAEKAVDRVARIIDLYREGTDWDVDRNDAREMADVMFEHMSERQRSFLPRPELLTDDEDREDVGLPLSLREFVVLEPFEPIHFHDFRDENGDRIHSLESFLTVWSSVQTLDDAREEASSEPGAGGGGDGEDAEEEADGAGSGGGTDGDTQGDLGGGRSIDGSAAEGGLGTGASGGQGGGETASGVGHRININFAPRAVLFGLMDRGDVPSGFWDDIVEHRNTEDDEASDSDNDDEPLLDEFGKEVIPYLYFSGLDDLAELDDWNSLEPIVQTELQDMLTVESDVFSVVVTARRVTGADGGEFDWTDRDEIEDQRESGSSLVRVVRCVVWRVSGDDGAEMIPLERWEVLDHLFYEVQDFPDDDR